MKIAKTPLYLALFIGICVISYRLIAFYQKEHMQPTQVKNWLDSFDIEGDGSSDHIYFDYTAGGHCCYKINIKLSSEKEIYHFPFLMDGGYIFGVDSGQPNQFYIKDIDQDGLPEILMQIETYNAKEEKINSDFTKEYGIKTNRIVIQYAMGKIQVSDYKAQHIQCEIPLQK